MAKNSIEAYGAQGKSNVLFFDPEDLHLVTEPGHPLYDERVHLPIHEPTVLNMMHHGVLQAITINKNPETGRVEVVTGRQRVKNAREANKRLRAQGCEPIMVPAIPRRAEGSDLAGVMVSENALRTDETPIGRAKKMQHLRNLGKDDAALSILFGCSIPTVRSTLALLDLSAPVRSALEAGKITATHAAKLVNLEPSEQKARLAEIVKAGEGLNGHAKAREQRKAASNGAEAPKMRSRKEISALIASKNYPEHNENGYEAALLWVLGQEA